MKMVQRITSSQLPFLEETHRTRWCSEAMKMCQDPTHPGHDLLTLLPSGKTPQISARSHQRADEQFLPHSWTHSNFSPWDLNWRGTFTQLAHTLIKLRLLFIHYCCVFIIHCAVTLLGLCDIISSQGNNGQSHYILTTVYLTAVNMVQSTPSCFIYAIVSILLFLYYSFYSVLRSMSSSLSWKSQLCSKHCLVDRVSLITAERVADRHGVVTPVKCCPSHQREASPCYQVAWVAIKKFDWPSLNETGVSPL